MNPILWQPTPEAAAATQIAELAREQGFPGPDAIGRLWQWSIDNPEPFWRRVWELGGVVALRGVGRPAAEGRELGDAGGPLLVAAVATLTTLTHGYAALAVMDGKFSVGMLYAFLGFKLLFLTRAINLIACQ